MQIKTSSILMDDRTQPRAKVDLELIEEYAADMEKGDDFPPIVIFGSDDEYVVADGFHRLAAADDLDWEYIEADVRDGGIREATLYSVGANAKHGKRRTNEDKRRVVKKLLEDKEWSQWSDREIARRCRVSHPFVSQARESLSGNGYQIEAKRKVKRGGKVYLQDTANIGQSQPSSDTENSVIEQTEQEASSSGEDVEDEELDKEVSGKGDWFEEHKDMDGWKVNEKGWIVPDKDFLDKQAETGSGQDEVISEDQVELENGQDEVIPEESEDEDECPMVGDSRKVRHTSEEELDEDSGAITIAKVPRKEEVAFTLRLPEDLDRRLKLRAGQERTSKIQVVTKAIARYLQLPASKEAGLKA